MDTPLLVLYGSQTGNAQDVAERIGREAKLMLFSPRVLAMDAYDVSSLPSEALVVCVASTTGQGDPPDNMQRFWRFLLRKSLPPDSLASMHYSVFGLGDSGYPKFNVTAKKLDRRLAGLGATCVLEWGLGDDQHPNGYEAALDPWLAKLWLALRRVRPLPDGVTQPAVSEEQLLQLGSCKYQLAFLGPEEAAQAQQALAAQLVAQHGEAVAAGHRELAEAMDAASAFRQVVAHASGAPLQRAEQAAGSSSGGAGPRFGPWQPYLARMVANERITAPDHFQDTRHVELELGSSGLGYEPGDLLAVMPLTSGSAIDAFLQRLGLDGDAWVAVQAAHGPAGPSAAGPRAVCRVRALVQGCLDVCGASPRRYLFQVLRHFATEEREQERLAYFATAEGRDDLYRYNQREGRTVAEVLADFRSAQPPLEWLLEACPPLRPRLFSVSSSLALRRAAPQAHLTVALVRYTTPYKRIKQGLCSAYLASLDPRKAEARVAVWIERGALRMPKDPRTPLLMVGPGTGVAPFRSFLEERYSLLQQQQQQQQALTAGANGQQQLPHEGPAANGHLALSPPAGVPAPCMLFFGCRSSSADFYYRQQWQEYQRLGVLHPQHGLVTAFSREQPSEGGVAEADGIAAASGGGQLPELEHRTLLKGVDSSAESAEAANVTAGIQGAPAAAANGPAPAASSAGGKVYVQQRIREHGATVWRLLSEQGAVVYVSGSAQKMPAGVLAAFHDVVRTHGGLSREEAERYVRQMELQGRYNVEAWS